MVDEDAKADVEVDAGGSETIENAPARARDPLLLVSKLLVGLLAGLTIFAIAMVGIGALAVVAIERKEILAKLARAGEGMEAYAALIGVLLAIMLALFLAYHFFASLYELIRSVDRDPFQPRNATLLDRMGWLSVGVQLLMLAITLPARWLVSIAERIGEKATFDSGIGIGSLLLTLVLFILAGIFRRGAEMRADLEGTV